ncbi:MAG: nucleotidyl transferase AbiEii/AbiGii toxin family protein [bacterium]
MKHKNNIIGFLESLGFETTFSSDAFSNHLHSEGSARIDIMYIDGSTADEIFKSTKNRLLFKDIRLPVVSAEHLIAMKLFAIQNNPERKFKDLADIKEILKYAECNKHDVREYFKKYGQYEYYKELNQGSIDDK